MFASFRGNLFLGFRKLPRLPLITGAVSRRTTNAVLRGSKLVTCRHISNVFRRKATHVKLGGQTATQKSDTDVNLGLLEFRFWSSRKRYLPFGPVVRGANELKHGNGGSLSGSAV